MKVIVNFNKKSPISGVEFSSVGAGISIESDLGDNKGDEDIKTMSRHLYVLAKGIVDQSLASYSNGNHSPNENTGSNSISGNHNQNGARANGNSKPSRGNNSRPITEKQKNFLISLCQKRFRGGVNEFEGKLRQDGVESIGHLTKRQASRFIEDFKSNGR